LTGFDPNHPGETGWPVLDGDGKGPVVSFTQREDASCILAGFVITGGIDRTTSAIRCSAAGPTIANCLIAGNRATEWNGTAIDCKNSNAAFVNCTIADNRCGQFGAAFASLDSPVTIVNSILWGNYPKEITFDGDYMPDVRYCTVAGGGWLGTGDLASDPLFAALGRWVDRNNPAVTVSPSDARAIWLMGDYHLQSQVGRWDPQAGAWMQDGASSPCIDGGDPAVPVGPEPLPNGGIINMGAYGGTSQASKSGP
jgi:hypothetical protein